MSLPRTALAAEPLLTPAEVVELARRIEAGVLARAARLEGWDVPAEEEELRALEDIGTAAFHRFVRANLRLVAQVSAATAARTRLPEADLFQEGCLGLMLAVQRFDHTRGFTFATYALAWIRSYVGAGSARQLGALNLPTSRAEQLRAARGVETALAQQLGRPATTAEVASALGRSERWTSELLAHRPPAPLDPGDAGAPVPLAELADDVAAEVDVLLARLDPVERRVLELRHGFADGRPCTRAQTAERLALPLARVRRLEASALRALRRLRTPEP